LSRFLSPRFGAEAGFLIAVAAVLYLLEASRPAIVGGMFVAWLAVAVFEVIASRDRAEPAPPEHPAETPAAVAVVPGGEEEELYVAPAAQPAPAAPASTETSAVTPTPAAAVTEGLPARPEDAPPEEPDLVEPAVPAEPAAEPVGEAEPFGGEPSREPESVPAAAAPATEPEARPEPEEALSAAAAASEPEPSPMAEPAAREEGEEPPAPAPAPEREPEEAFPPPPPPPVLTPVASAPPEPPRPEEEREGAAAAQPEDAPEVVELRPGRPSGWNVWELERMVRESEGSDPSRADERAYLLMYLRDFASPDGVLPPDFDGLVRESFGDLLAIRR
jgi:hypothetical protein